MEKRDVVWFTVFEEVIETVEVVKTVWVAPGDLPVSTSMSTTTTQSTAATTATPVLESPAPPILLQIPTTTSTPVAPVSQAPPPPTSVPAPPPPADTPAPAPVAPAPIAVPVPAPAPAAAPALAPAPAPSPASAPAPAPAPVSILAQADSGSAGNITLAGASVGSACTAGTPCVGDMTFYNPSMGTGACGPKPDGHIYEDTDMVVAVAVKMMGSLSSGLEMNHLCWKKLHIFNPETGLEATGMVVDKCFGCVSSPRISPFCRDMRLMPNSQELRTLIFPRRCTTRWALPPTAGILASNGTGSRSKGTPKRTFIPGA